MIDPIINLVFSVQSNKGVYALLLGSGVSRSSGIPTGWEIVIDLIEKMAGQIGESCQPDPAAWFKSKYGKFPDYSKLLDELAKTPSERNNLLKAYFEPTFEDKENGLKMPTQAHRSIAKLIGQGFIKIVITTNFDRLLEQALAEVGVVPIVISTPDAVDGALPITHSSCSIIKVHGDYLDTRIKNTPKELEKFDKRLNALLDRIFDEFGLIICGWSSEWDKALRNSIEKCKSRRFTTFWALRGKPNNSAKNLIDLRGAQTLDIKDSDSFFSELSEKVFSLEEISRPHPLSAKLAVETTKRYLRDEQSIIRLNDLVLQETEKVYDQIMSVPYPAGGLDQKGFVKLLNRFQAILETLQSIIIVGCFWGAEIHQDIWVKCFERIANIKGPTVGPVGRFKPKLYPAILLLYSGGIASIASSNFGTLYAIFNKPKVFNLDSEKPLGLFLNPWSIFPNELGNLIPGQERAYTPLQNHLYTVVREPLKEFVANDYMYEKYFDKFEYLFSLSYADLENKKYDRNDFRFPYGRFGWKAHEYGMDTLNKIYLEIYQNEFDSLKKHGFFDGSLSRFEELHSGLVNFVKGLNFF